MVQENSKKQSYTPKLIGVNNDGLLHPCTFPPLFSPTLRAVFLIFIHEERA